LWSTVSLQGPAIDWIGVIVIDHPSPPPKVDLEIASNGIPMIALLRRDWEFLFDQRRSTYAVVQYLHRVGGPTKHLGEEPARYYELALLDLAASNDPVDPRLEDKGIAQSARLLPAAPAGSDDDAAHGVFRMMLEDIAVSDLEPGEEGARLRVLASINSLPVAHRSQLGRLLLDAPEASANSDPEAIRWRSRIFLSAQNHDQLGFAMCSVFNEATRAAFNGRQLLRHHERGEIVPLDRFTSVGVLLTPRKDGLRQWDTTVFAVTGDPELSQEELDQFREFWNKPPEHP
jgi:hypothetical protein